MKIRHTLREESEIGNEKKKHAEKKMYRVELQVGKKMWVLKICIECMAWK